MKYIRVIKERKKQEHSLKLFNDQLPLFSASHPSCSLSLFLQKIGGDVLAACFLTISSSYTLWNGSFFAADPFLPPPPIEMEMNKI